MTGPRKLLETAIVQYLDEHYPSHIGSGDRWRLPTGLRIEMHPSTMYQVRADIADLRFSGPDPNLADRLGIPVKINSDLGEYEWRLVVVTEDVKIGGKLP